jgi:hypothetical protein
MRGSGLCCWVAVMFLHTSLEREQRPCAGYLGHPLRKLAICASLIFLCYHFPVERFHRTYGQECLQIHHPSPLQEVTRPSPRRFSSTTMMNVPQRRRTCGNVPPRVAFPTLPTLPALPERVDPDAWLASLDQKMYLRHVGRDGCVDLATYDIGSQLAGRTILLPVRAEHRQFAVW